jgi:hypothetical protein
LVWALRVGQLLRRASSAGIEARVRSAAGQRLLRPARAHLGPRFADYLVVDGEFARAPLPARGRGAPTARDRATQKPSSRVVRGRPEPFSPPAPQQAFPEGQDRVEIWDAADFDPWETLRWQTVRVIRCRQHQPNGQVVEAYWLTDLPASQVGSRTLYRLAKSRWEIENQGFNDAKNRYGFEHLCHHERNRLLLGWLLAALALTLERLYRLRRLHRGTHPLRSALALWQLLWLSLSRPVVVDTS